MDSTLRANLEALRDKTANAGDMPAPGFWVGDKADERRVRDDLAGGRLAFRAAHTSAIGGLSALDAGDSLLALTCLCEGYNLLIGALAGRLRPSDCAYFMKPAGKRGRPRGSKNVKGR